MSLYRAYTISTFMTAGEYMAKIMLKGRTRRVVGPRVIVDHAVADAERVIDWLYESDVDRLMRSVKWQIK